MAVLGGLLLGAWLFWLGLIFVLFCLYFFRDPSGCRRTGRGWCWPGGWAGRRGHAGGAAGRARPGQAPRWRVAIFLSVMDVHVNRVPVDGTVTRIAYRHGKYLNAALDKASDDNERNAIAIRLPDGRDMAVVQIAGLIARRILCDIREAMRCRRATASASSASAAAPMSTCRKASARWWRRARP